MNREFIEKVTEWTKECLEHQLTEKEKIEIVPIENGIRVDYRKGCKHKNKEFVVPFSAQEIKKFCRSAMNREELKEYKRACTKSHYKKWKTKNPDYNKNYYEENSDKWVEYREARLGNYIYIYKKNNEYLYIGKTNDLYQRKINHSRNNGSLYLYECLKKEDCEIYFINVENVNNNELLYIEKYLIKKYNPIFNIYKKNVEYAESNRSISNERKLELQKIADNLEYEIIG